MYHIYSYSANLRIKWLLIQTYYPRRTAISKTACFSLQSHSFQLILNGAIPFSPSNFQDGEKLQYKTLKKWGNWHFMMEESRLPSPLESCQSVEDGSRESVVTWVIFESLGAFRVSHKSEK